MARKKGSKRARLFVGGSFLGSRGRGGFSQEAADNIKKGALLAQQDVKPAATTKTVQPATGAQSARDFAPEVEGAGTSYQVAAAEPKQNITQEIKDTLKSNSSVAPVATPAQNEAAIQEQEAKTGAGWAPPNSGINTMANVTLPPGIEQQINASLGRAERPGFLRILFQGQQLLPLQEPLRLLRVPQWVLALDALKPLRCLNKRFRCLRQVLRPP